MGGGGYAARLFLLLSFPCSADHERDWPPCKVVFFGLATNTLNVRNNNNNIARLRDQPGKVASPARDELNRKNNISLSAFVPENLVSRDGFGSPVPRQPAHLHTQAEYGAYLRDSSRVPRWCPFIHLLPPYAIGSVPSLSGHAIAYRWRSLPRVRRHGASKPQGSSERVLPWQVTMDQLIFASLSHTHYWYEVGMLKVPAYTCITGPVDLKVVPNECCLGRSPWTN